MTKLPQVSGSALVRALKRDGWIEAGQKGTLASILKDARLSIEKLKKLL